jgi:iron-sulfur cluster repair protein YtfE (RIC family)
LALLAQEFVDSYGSTRTELPVIAATLKQLDVERTHHLAKEEMVLFPYITVSFRQRCVINKSVLILFDRSRKDTTHRTVST